MHRLRDLDRRQRTVAAVLVGVVLVPFAVSVGRAVHHAWLPTGDNALIGLRALDVWSQHRPLIGQPSTSFLYGPSMGSNHPGPIEFYWLAVPMRLLGPAVGMIAGAAFVNLASVGVAAWVVLRRAGPTVAVWSLVGLGGVLWSEGTAVLSDPISSNVGGIPLLALAALAWAVSDGDVRLLPLAALFGSWVLQQHLAIVVPALSVLTVGAAGLGMTVARWRWRRRSGAHAAVEESLEPVRLWPWLGAATAIGVVAWFPVAWQQITGHPGNLTAILDYAQGSQRPTVGLGAGLRAAARAIGSPPLLTRWDLSGFDFLRAPLGVVETAVAALVHLVVVATAMLAWRRQPRLALLAATTVALTLGGIYNTSTIPAGIEVDRISFYRWAFVVAWLAWTVIGWLVVLAMRELSARSTPRVVPLIGRAALVAATVLLIAASIASIVAPGVDDVRNDQAGFRAVRDLSAAALDAAAGKEQITLVLRGRAAPFSAGQGLTLQLEARGHQVVLPGVDAQFYGQQRVLQPGDDPGDLVLELVTARGQVPGGPGRTLARRQLNQELNEIVRPLVDRARAGQVQVAPGADTLLRQRWPDPRARRDARNQLAQIAVDPYSVLTEPMLVDIVRRGYFASPTFDDQTLEAASRAGPAATVWGDDVFELRVLNRAELAQEVPSWAKG